jgi:DNA-binding LytR/AlgR family response regulator
MFTKRKIKMNFAAFLTLVWLFHWQKFYFKYYSFTIEAQSGYRSPCKIAKWKILMIHVIYIFYSFNLSPMEILLKHLNPTYFNPDNSSEELTSGINNLQGRKIVVMDKQECIFINLGDISYAEASGAYANIYLNNGNKMVISKNLKALAEKLPAEEFIRIHKSYIININSIRKYIKSDGGYIILENNKSIPVSIRKKDVITRLVEQLSL